MAEDAVKSIEERNQKYLEELSGNIGKYFLQESIKDCKIFSNTPSFIQLRNL